MIRKLIPLAVFLVMALFLGIGLTLDPKKLPSPLIDKPLPVFSLPRLLEPARQLGSADLKDDVVLLNVWASWCASCRIEHPWFVKASKQQLIPIYGLNYKDSRKEGTQWLQQLGNPYIASGFDESGDVGIELGVYGVPETFLIDRLGVVRYKHVGPVTEAVWQQELKPRVDALRQER